ncbi:acyloxyacyl hydrolase [Oceanibium sediminis]|uniref:acyloxyacyl hydrolase n=1 Tax=Oceanibium sediminis TaxID=2026339 RepID=UPI000DD3A9D2|nr:acyloxyacyl hydrolase [Oceanibium sediminis]
MIEDGTVAILFWLIALGSAGLDRQDGWFERDPAPGSVVVSGGQTSIRRSGRGEARQTLSEELRLQLYQDRTYGPLQPVAEVSVTADGGTYLGAGFAMRRDFDLGGLPLFAGGEVVTGLWLQGGDVDLGGPIEFRTGLELGVRFDEWRLSVMTDHRSNAGLYRENPGLESISLRLHIPF